MDFCVACGKTSAEKRLLNSKAGNEKQLTFLFKFYTELDISEGYLCLNCHRKLLSIHKSVTSFKEQCKKTHEKSTFNPPVLSDISIVNTCINIKPKFTSVQPECEDSVSTIHVDNKTKRSTSDSEHSYCKEKGNACNKKQKYNVTKSECNTGIPHISEHDHNYYSGAITDKSSFDVPRSVCQYFEQTEHIESTNLSNLDKITLVNCVHTGDVSVFIDTLLKIPQMYNRIISHLIRKVKIVAGGMSNTKKGFVSQLMQKDLEHMENLEWDQLVLEFEEKFPSVFKILVAIMLPEKENFKQLSHLLPRIGLMYSLLMQARHPSLSLVQRTVSMLLMDNICDQKVYDRLQVLGVCLSYQKSLYILELLGGSFNTAAIEAVSKKKTIRIIGDNVNFKTSITEQHYSNNGKTSEMHHAFANALLINNFKFLDGLDCSTPQRAWQDVRPVDFLMTEDERMDVKLAYVQMVSKVIGRFIPSLSFMSEVVPQTIMGDHSKLLTEKTLVVPLETMPLNEQKYEDVVQILEKYENIVVEMYRQADANLKDDESFHIVDLINDLYIGGLFLMQDVGTMKCEINRIRRTNFNEDVNSSYDADKDFIISYIDAHIVELVLEYFGMETIHSNPTIHIPPEFITDQEKKRWVYLTIGDLLDEYLLMPKKTASTSHSANNPTEDDVIEDASIIRCTLADGRSVEIQINKNVNNCKKVKHTDGVLNYATLVLNLGLLFKELLDVCKTPDRKRLIRLMKQCLIIFKAKSNQSKYAVEVLRFLMQQNVLLSEKCATSTLYSMFVNTKGKIDTHIPADLQMEYLVKLTKKHIKHMFSNKSSQNISKKTRALSCIESVCNHFDEISDVKVRCKKHSHPSYHDDELMMIDDLRSVRPFKKCVGRMHSCFKNIKMSLEEYLEPTHFHEWIQRRIRLDGTDLGI